MSRKTNKTNHVLNLLSAGVKRPDDPEETENRAEELQSDSPAENRKDRKAPAEHEEKSGVAVVHRGEDTVAEQIRTYLETELEQLEEKQSQDIAEEQTNEEDKGPCVEEEATTETEEPEHDFIMVNVMERLVRERAPKYMEQFHTCQCARCKADVIAQALTSLPARYVVINKNAVSPLMNFYTVKYAGLITVAVTKACMKIQEAPHHGEEDSL